MRLCYLGALRRRFFPLNLERIAVSYRSGFPLPDSSGLLPARPKHALRTCYVCLIYEFYPLNLERVAVACSSGFPLPDLFWIIICQTNTCITDMLCLLDIRLLSPESTGCLGPLAPPETDRLGIPNAELDIFSKTILSRSTFCKISKRILSYLLFGSIYLQGVHLELF